MKKLITFIIAFTISISTFAQNGINYKALIKDGNGNVVASQNVDLQFIIYKGAALTNNVYQETHTSVMTDANGIIIVNIGEGAIDSGVYEDIDWGSDDHYLNVWINTGSGLTDMATTQFRAVPYALSAANVAFNTVNNITSNVPGDLSTDSFVFGSSKLDEDITISDDNSKMYFNKEKSAFRAGYTFGDLWNDNKVGYHSSAFGFGTVAVGAYSTALGQLNVEDNNALFVVGNGTTDVLRNNALSLFDNSSFVVGSYQLNNNPSTATDDTRFFFNKPRGAFRAGFANGTQWDDSQIGDYSTAFGFVTKANGARSTALGSGTIASGFATTAIGNYNAEVLDAYFIVGNGTGDPARKNAMVVKSNGDLIVGSSQLDDDITTADDNARVFFNKAKGAFRAGLVDDTYWDDSEVGSYSVSMGLNTKAKGQNSFAMGGNSTATGKDAVAMGGLAIASGLNAISLGNQTNASNVSSVALGAGTSATGVYSTAMNLSTNANAMASTSIGRHNIGTGNTNSWVETDPLFEIGKGTDDANRSNALTVLKNGTITAPSFDLAQITDPKALVTKEYVDTNTLATGLEQITEETSLGSGVFNSGWRLKGAIPENYGPIGSHAVDLSEQNNNSTTNGATGRNSLAVGFNARASGINSTAIGFNSIASELNSTAIGLSADARGDNSTALGAFTYAGPGSSSTAIGENTTASGINSTAVGLNTEAQGDNSTAMGNNTIAFGKDSFAVGANTNATANNSTAIGNNTSALGVNSTSMGIHTIATAYASTSIGKFNESDLDGLFIIGNGVGTVTAQRNNALIVRTNGDAQFDGEIQHTSTGSANMIPIAYGGVNGAATPVIQGGTENFTVTRNITTNEYTISVNGESLSSSNSVISVSINTSNFRSHTVTFSGGNAIVHIFTSSFVKVASPFQFVIYQE